MILASIAGACLLLAIYVNTHEAAVNLELERLVQTLLELQGSH